MTDTKTLPVIPGVPPELVAAFEDSPLNFDLLGVMADAADENGELLVGDCLRWMWVKRRSPRRDPEGCPGGGRGWVYTDGWGYDVHTNNQTHSRQIYIPRKLAWRCLNSASAQFEATKNVESLIQVWKQSTPTEREGYWNWTPPEICK